MPAWANLFSEHALGPLHDSIKAFCVLHKRFTTYSREEWYDISFVCRCACSQLRDRAIDIVMAAHAAATPVLDARDATALAVWVQHVAVRQPLLLQDLLETDDFQQLSRWTNQYLRDQVVPQADCRCHLHCCASYAHAWCLPLSSYMKCKWQMAIGLHTNIHNNLQGADVRVKVEVRQSAAAPFGRGITQLMPFRQFLRRFAAGDSSMYMTAQARGAGGHHTAALLLQPLAKMPLSSAMLCISSTCQLKLSISCVQDVKVSADGHPELFAPPITQLQADLPLQPACMGNLIPQQLNLWMGNSPDGEQPGRDMVRHSHTTLQPCKTALAQ